MSKLQFKHKNIIITKISFDPDRVEGYFNDQKFIVDIMTDNQGEQHIIIGDKKYFLSQFIIKN